jgi:hypothetical protein
VFQIYTGSTQNNGAVVIVNTIKTAPFFCVCPVYIENTGNVKYERIVDKELILMGLK